MQKVRIGLFNLHDLRYGGVLKLGKLLVGNKELTLYGKQPESLLGDVHDFNSSNALATNDGFHLTTPVGKN